MVSEAPYISFSEKPKAKSLVFSLAAAKNTEQMRTRTVLEHREIISRRSELRPIPSNLLIERVDGGDVPCEWIFRKTANEKKVILYIHGGSWMTGNLKTAQPFGCLLAETVDCRVLVVDYSLAPESPFPAGLEDCMQVFDYLLELGYSESDIALFGDSAGGNLSLALMHLLKESSRPLPICIGLASPATDITQTSAIMKSGDNIIYTLHDGCEVDIFTLYAGETGRDNPLVSPYCGDLHGFPPILIHVGGDEPMALDCVAFAKKAFEANVEVNLKVFKEMFHDFTIVGIALKESRDSIKEFGEFFRKYFK